VNLSGTICLLNEMGGRKRATTTRANRTRLSDRLTQRPLDAGCGLSDDGNSLIVLLS
jgi:hypothetical protein